MDIRFVYFDLDDTLLDHRHAEQAALADVRAAFPDAFDGVSDADLHETYRTHSRPLWQKYAAGAIEKTELKVGRFERTLDTLGVQTLDATAVSDYYLDCYAKHWRFIPEARTAFMHLADRLPVGILTNGFAQTQAAKFDRFPVLRKRSRALVVSEETGYLKPHAGVFTHAAERAGVPPAHILYVGDSYRSDVEGGHAAGWHVAWYRRHGATAPSDIDCFAFTAWDALIDWLA